MPSEIVAVDARGRLVVLNSRSGSVVRTLARNVATFRGDPELAVSPDGTEVYFTSVAPPTPGCRTSGIETVFRVPRGGGAPVTVGRGRTVAVSRDGAVAFSRDYENCTFSGPGGLEIDDPPRSRILRDPPTHEQDRELVLFNLSWSGDGRLLTFDRAKGADRRPYVVDPQHISSLDDAVCLCAAPSNLRTFGFLGDSTEHLGAELSGATRRYAADAVVARADGSIDRTLFRWDHDITTLRSDSSGQNVVMTSPTRALGGGGYGFALYRWRKGDRRPTKVRDGIVAAAWLPTATAPSPPATQIAVAGGSDVPRNVVRVLDASDGHEVRRVETGTDPVTGVAATPDGAVPGSGDHPGRRLGLRRRDGDRRPRDGRAASRPR